MTTSDSLGEEQHLINSHLCQDCQTWDNLWDFDSSRGAPRSLEDILHLKECLVCQAVSKSVVARCSGEEQWKQWPASSISVSNDGPFFLDHGAYPPRVPHRIDTTDSSYNVIKLLMKLTVAFISQSNVPEEISQIVMSPQLRLIYSKSEQPQLVRVEPWEVPFVDFSLPRTWIQGCEDIHGDSCAGGMHGFHAVSELPSGFRVIDVNKMAIMRPVEQLRYVALSYMWQQCGDNHAQLEKQNLEELETPNGLTNISIPNIILDAISLCKELGERYLWVDRLCIVQNDAESKHRQIHGMDKIYRSSTFTIVAALNDRDGRGLPGIPNRPRRSSIWVPERGFKIEGRGVRSNGMQAIVDPSLWNRRGWTFQERVLSRRRLFITDYQVIFECTRGQAFEELTYCTRDQSVSYSTDGLVDPNSDLERAIAEREVSEIPSFARRTTYDRNLDYNLNDATSSLVDYFNWVQDYTSRQLSFSIDILNAFAGVGTLLAQTFKTKMIFGHPERYLPQSLMWSCLGTVERRLDMPQIPSWSWASSLKPANFYWLNGQSSFKGDLAKIASIVYFHYQDPDHGLRKLNVEERWIENELTIKDFETYPGVPPLSGKYIPGVNRSIETWCECPHNPWQTLAHQALDAAACQVAFTKPGALVFNTTVASLMLGHDERNIYEKEDGEEKDVAIRNHEGALVGWLNKMDRAWIDDHVGGEKTYEFIAISGSLENWRTRKTMAQYLRDFDMWRLQIMLIERVGPHPCVVRRVQVGYLFAHLWKLCSPRWETVVLV